MDTNTQVEIESTVSLWGSLEKELGLSGRFAILSRIGAGGMGEVFKAHQHDIDRDVAIKVLAVDIQSSADAKMRFLREAKILSNLAHPNISKLYSFGFSGERPYQIMDYLEGCSLSTRLEQGPLTVEEFRSIFSQIISALKYASSQGLVHRDVKPGNIFLTKNADQSPRAVLLDFGLVRQLELNDGSGTLTATQAVLGSPPYMSPEQCRGAMVDSASDIYSLGCTMHEALAGKPPFLSDTVGEILLKQMNEPPPMLQAFQNSKPIAAGLPPLIHKCLSKPPSERYSSFQELESAFEHALLFTPSTSTFTQPRTIAGSNKRAVVTAIACSLALAVLAGLSANKLSTMSTPRGDSLSSEKQKQEEVRKWKVRFDSTGKKPAEQDLVGDSLITAYLNLGDHYKNKKPHHDDAERVYTQALNTARSMQDPKWSAKCWKALSELNELRSQAPPPSKTRRELLKEAERYAKKAVAQIVPSNSKVLKVECLMQLGFIYFQLGDYAEAATQVEQASSYCLKKAQVRFELGANAQRSYARKIQDILKGNATKSTNKDKLAICESFLSILEVIAVETSITAEEPALQYAHQWFKQIGTSKEDPIIVSKAAQLQVWLDEFDKLAAHPKARSDASSMF